MGQQVTQLRERYMMMMFLGVNLLSGPFCPEAEGCSFLQSLARDTHRR